MVRSPSSVATALEVKNRAIALKNRHRYLNSTRKSYSDEFYTPRWITEALGLFDLDPCAGPTTQHGRRNIRPPRDGLKIHWHGRVWLNPPYSNVHVWLDRFVEHANGIALVNARCETGWFQRLAQSADAFLFLQGRVPFRQTDGRDNHPPCGSVLVAMGTGNAESLRLCGLSGLFLRPARRQLALTSDH